jgi:IS5 family transposase
MREKIHGQQPLVPRFIAHEHAHELSEISRTLDELGEIETLVERDLLRGGVAIDKGRPGLTAEQVLRVVVLKQMKGYSYEELAFHLSDSQSFRAFCRFGLAFPPLKRSTLQENVARISPATWEALNTILVRHAKLLEIESGEKVRVDCTTVETNVHAPTDSSLLMDTVRILTKLLEQAHPLADIAWSDHRRRAKRRAIGVLRAPSAEQRKPLYVDLLRVTEQTIEYAKNAARVLDTEATDATRALALKLTRVAELGGRVVAQTRNRVVLGKSVPVAEKVTSIVEPHTDIIVKSRDEVIYGHKICLNVGASGLVLDCVVHHGNPADVTLAVTMIERHSAILGAAPAQAVFDGAFSSKANLAAMKALGVDDVVFTKSHGIRLSEMASSTFVYRALRRFRAGVEGCISFLKRCFGLDRCTWKGFASFLAYVQASVFSANVLLIARHRMT